MNDFDDMTPAEREAWFAKRLQMHSDDTIDRLQADDEDTGEDQADDRLWLGLVMLLMIVVFVLGANAWLKTLGYGA